jgi:hypothetical protein
VMAKIPKVESMCKVWSEAHSRRLSKRIEWTGHPAEDEGEGEG